MILFPKARETYYAQVTQGEEVRVDGFYVGDLVNQYTATGNAWSAILTIAAGECPLLGKDRSFGNGRFHTRDGALNYMLLVAACHNRAER